MDLHVHRWCRRDVLAARGRYVVGRPAPHGWRHRDVCQRAARQLHTSRTVGQCRRFQRAVGASDDRRAERLHWRSRCRRGHPLVAHGRHTDARMVGAASGRHGDQLLGACGRRRQSRDRHHDPARVGRRAAGTLHGGDRGQERVWRGPRRSGEGGRAHRGHDHRRYRGALRPDRRRLRLPPLLEHDARRARDALAGGERRRRDDLASTGAGGRWRGADLRPRGAGARDVQRRALHRRGGAGVRGVTVHRLVRQRDAGHLRRGWRRLPRPAGRLGSVRRHVRALRRRRRRLRFARPRRGEGARRALG